MDSWGQTYDFTALVEEFFNKAHDDHGRFTSEGSSPSSENSQHIKTAQENISKAKKIVPADTKEGIVLNHVHKTLSLYTVGKTFAKANQISADIQKKFDAADEWLKTDPTPEKVGLVHKLVNKAKSALSYMTGGDLKHFAYINAAAGVLGLAAHFAQGISFPVGEGSKRLWPPPGWGNKIIVH